MHVPKCVCMCELMTIVVSYASVCCVVHLCMNVPTVCVCESYAVYQSAGWCTCLMCVYV